MRWRSYDWISLALLALCTAVAVYLYPALPDPVPTHWNTAGEVNGYTPKPWGVFIMPLTMLGIWLVFKVIPVISPRGFRMDTFMQVVGIVQTATLAVLAAIGIASLLDAAGWSVPIDWVVGISVAGLLIVMGNYMGKIRRNFFIGVRTPWTLASERVWYATHRFAAWVFVVAGLLIIPAIFLGWTMWAILVLTLGAAVITVVYSFLLYRRLEGFNKSV